MEPASRVGGSLPFALDVEPHGERVRVLPSSRGAWAGLRPGRRGPWDTWEAGQSANLPGTLTLSAVRSCLFLLKSDLGEFPNPQAFRVCTKLFSFRLEQNAGGTLPTAR